MNDSDQATPLYDNLRKLINIIDELRDVGLQQIIKLPRIAVLGSQSSGKSSLLEMIVGIDFLPRGAGVVTRRPLELRLIDSPHVEVPYAVFDANKNEKFTDFDKVRLRIEQLTDEIAGTNKNIIDKEIVLTLYSSNVPDLTIIDLPGLTRIPVGAQPHNIEEITCKMSESGRTVVKGFRFVMDERTIILCVIPANIDIATSDALEMALRIDPNKNRTIGVFTKIDIMGNGTDARERLSGKDIPLKLGYVGVKGRSQEDIQNNVRVKAALAAEKEFFEKNYSDLSPALCGTHALVTKLTKVLFQHIREFLPQIYKEIHSKSKECEDRLKDLGEAPPSDITSKSRLLWDKTSQFTQLFKNFVRGNYDKRSFKSSDEISGGARIKLLFQNLYKDWLNQRPTARYEEKDIQRAIDIHQGDSIPGFPSIDSFLCLIHPLLKELKKPALDLLDDVALHMDLMATEIINKTFERFPSLAGEVTDCISKLIREEKENTLSIIENIIEAEQAYIFTNDPEYLSKRTNIIPVQPNSNNPYQQQVDPQKLFVREMRDRLDSYFGIIIRNIRDTVPKVIGFFLVKTVQDKMQFTLHSEMNRNETAMGLLDESPIIAAEREALTKVLDVLQKAKKVLSKEPDLVPLSFNQGDSSVKKEINERRENESSKTKPAPKKAEDGSSKGLFGNYLR